MQPPSQRPSQRRIFAVSVASARIAGGTRSAAMQPIIARHGRSTASLDAKTCRASGGNVCCSSVSGVDSFRSARIRRDANVATSGICAAKNHGGLGSALRAIAVAHGTVAKILRHDAIRPFAPTLARTSPALPHPAPDFLPPHPPTALPILTFRLTFLAFATATSALLQSGESPALVKSTFQTGRKNKKNVA